MTLNLTLEAPDSIHSHEEGIGDESMTGHYSKGTDLRGMPVFTTLES
jgi:hypothetical protein